MDELILLNQLEIIEGVEEFVENPNRDFWTNWVRVDIFESMSEKEFLKSFRMPKDTVLNLIQELDELLEEKVRVSSIPKNMKILLALNFYATGGYQKTIGSNKYMAVSQSTVSRCIKEVTTALNHPRIFNKWVKFSMRTEDLSYSRTRFYQKYGIPGIVGIVDCTHVAIVPPKENEHVYVNRKMYHSINVQLVCDIDLKILNVNSRYPGSTHDSYIWNSSNLKNILENATRNDQNFMYYLIGDSGYALRRWLQIPISNPEEGSSEEDYNKAFLSARSLIERCNGLLKMRFRCLLKHRVLHYEPVIAGKIVNACTVLHNICVTNRVPEPELDEEIDFGLDQEDNLDEQRNEPIRNPDLEAGRTLQRHIIENYF